MKKIKKPLAITLISLGSILGIAMGVGDYFVDAYEPVIDVFFSGDKQVEETDGEKECCEQIEEEGIVLLKNEDNALPLKDGEKKIALLGQNSVDFVYGGSGSGSVDVSNAPTLKSALESEGFTINKSLWDFYKTGPGKSYRKTTPNLSGDGEFNVNEVPRKVFTDNVKNSLDNDDVGICVFGRGSGESSDLPLNPLKNGTRYLELDPHEKDTLKLACEKFDKVIVLINSSNPMELGFLNEPEFKNVKACLLVGPVGQYGMNAIGRILNGKVSPSGKLVDTYAFNSQSAPSTKNIGDYKISNSQIKNGNNYIVYQEGIYVGYKYYETRYEDKILKNDNVGEFNYAAEVQFPFGYGLTYSDFARENYVVTEEENSFEVSIDVTNKGSSKGKDVVEIYMQSPYTSYDIQNGIEKSSIELVGFKKTKTLEQNETENIKISVPKELMKTYDSKGAKTYVVDEGDYYFTAASNAHEAINNILFEKDNSLESELIGELNKGFTYKYNQSSLDVEKYSKTNNGVKITNQFDDVDANYYDDCQYVTRSNWENSLPKSAYKNGNWSASDKLLKDLEFYRGDEVINGPQAKMPVWGSTATSYKVQDLVDCDYSDKKWDDLVSQLTYSQATRLVRLGGYSTIQIDDIGLPSTIDKDGPSGISGTLVGGGSTMAWPAEVVFASTRNEELIEKMGEYLGHDSINSKTAGWYAPGVNIHRTPYSGRNFEYFSEDGFLSGKIGAAEMRGVRSKGVIAYMKHFALNDQETNRYGGAIFANEQSIRENFLKGFEIVTREGKPVAAMAAMNRIGSRWVGAHKGIMTKVLRKEWGFEGVVITDQASSSAMFYQDMPSGLAAGTDLWLNTNKNFWKLDEYKTNATVMTNVQRAAKNIIYAVTKSNAVIDYKDGSGTNQITPNSMPAWKIGFIVLNVLWYIGCLLLIGIPVTKLILGKKEN